MIQGLLLHYRTYPADFSFEARYEIEDLLEELTKEFDCSGGERIQMNPDGMEGLIFIDLQETPIPTQEEERYKRTFTKRLEEGRRKGYWNNLSNPHFFNIVVPSDVENIATAVEKLKKRIQDKWRIKIRTRHRISRRETINEAAKSIDLPVDLEDPVYIIQIKCFGERTGIGVKTMEEGE